MEHRCRCAEIGGDCDNIPTGAVLGRRVNLCPWYHARNPHFAAVVHLTRCLDAGAVQGWPDAFAHGIVDGVHALRSARDDWQARQIKER